MPPKKTLTTRTRVFLARNHFAVFAAASLVLWLVDAQLTGAGPFRHDYHDVPTLQAMAWLHGRADLGVNYSYLEIARYRGKYQSSFGPVIALFELPFVVFFGRETPNSFVMVLAGWALLLLSIRFIYARARRWDVSYLWGCGLIWGGQLLYLSMRGSSWHQGHVYSVLFLTLATMLAMDVPPPIPGAPWLLRHAGAFSGILAGFATGCRPTLGAYACVILGCLWASGRDRRRKIIEFACSFGAIGLFLAAFNQIRYGSPFEFGQAHLPWSISLEHGIFSPVYLERNLIATFVQLPTPVPGQLAWTFEGHGTAVWLVAPFLVLGLALLFHPRLPKAHRWGALLTLALVGGMAMFHESNGWFQFGYRFGTDLIPLALGALAVVLANPAQPRGWNWVKSPWLGVLLTWAVLMNAYGANWFYHQF